MTSYVVHVPVTASLLVPVTVEHGGQVSLTGEKIGGVDVCDLSASEQGEDLAITAVTAATASAEVDAAVCALLGAVQLHRRTYPSTKAMLNPFLGVAQETKI